jgi:hypothetical protein
LIGLVALAGCGSSAPEKVATTEPEETIPVNLEGTWTAQLVIDEAEAAKADPGTVDLIRSMKMEMTFTDDGRLKLVGETNGQPYQDENTWQYLGQQDNVLKIMSVTSDGKQKEHEFFFNDANTFEMPLAIETAQVGAMRFTRVR